MPPPKGPMDIPPTAIAALASLRSRFEYLLPPGTEFGIGVKQTGGEFLDQLALTVFLPEKLPIDQIVPEQVIPPVWNEKGVEFVTDVVQSNPKPIALVNDSSFYSSLVGGIEIGCVEQIDAGTFQPHQGSIGCVVQRRSDGRRQLLTVNHVAPLLHYDGSQVEISQPAPRIVGGNIVHTPVIGKVVKSDLGWDCSVIELNGARGNPLPNVKEIGPVRGSASFQLWGVAKKRGRTTGLTAGVVTAVIPDAAFGITRIRAATFPFGGIYCDRGDSGSVVLNGTNEVIGLLAEMDGDTYDAAGQMVSSEGVAKPIQAVLDALEVEIAVTPPVVTLVQPDTAVGVLANGGWTQLDGWGFDAGSHVTFGGVAALSVTPASPRRLIVTPPVQFLPGVATDVIVTNGLGEQSLMNPSARFTY
ncbi:MAG: S1 family peptidase [Chloroflexota bacterium]|nr:S1 family peptidase [Chloroflexota bacterium]